MAKQPKNKLLWTDSTRSWRIVQVWFPSEDLRDGAPEWATGIEIEVAYRNDALGQPVWEVSQSQMGGVPSIGQKPLSELLVKASLLKAPVTE